MYKKLHNVKMVHDKKRKQEVQRILSNGDILPMNLINFNTNILLCHSLFIQREHKRSWSCRLTHLSVCLSFCLSVWKVYCGKTTDWIWMPFGMMSGVGQWMGILDGVVIVKGKGQIRR